MQKSRTLKCRAEIKKFLRRAQVLRLTETSGWAPLGSTSNSFGMAHDKRMSLSSSGLSIRACIIYTNFYARKRGVNNTPLELTNSAGKTSVKTAPHSTRILLLLFIFMHSTCCTSRLQVSMFVYPDELMTSAWYRWCCNIPIVSVGNRRREEYLWDSRVNQEVRSANIDRSSLPRISNYAYFVHFSRRPEPKNVRICYADMVSYVFVLGLLMVTYGSQIRNIILKVHFDNFHSARNCLLTTIFSYN